MGTLKITRDGRVIDRATGRHLGTVAKATQHRVVDSGTDAFKAFSSAEDCAWEALMPGEEPGTGTGGFARRADAAGYLAGVVAR